VTVDDKAQFARGPDVEHHLAKVQLFVDAGFVTWYCRIPDQILRALSNSSPRNWPNRFAPSPQPRDPDQRYYRADGIHIPARGSRFA
jgi:hypothetical protein